MLAVVRPLGVLALAGIVACADGVLEPRSMPDEVRVTYDQPLAPCGGAYPISNCGVVLTLTPHMTEQTASSYMFTNAEGGMSPEGLQLAPPTRAVIQVEFNVPLNRIDMEVLLNEAHGPGVGEAWCPTAGKIVVHREDGSSVTLPEVVYGGSMCNETMTLRSDVGITRLQLHPTPDAEALLMVHDIYGPVYNRMASHYLLRWDAPPTPQTPRCPPIGVDWLDSEAVRDSLFALLQQSNLDSNPERRRERGGNIRRNKATGEIGFQRVMERVSTPCTRELTNTYDPAYEIIATAHTHPFRLGKRTAKVKECGWEPTMPAPPFYNSAKIFSDSDWVNIQLADSIQTKILGDTTVPKMLVIDADSMYWIGAREDKKLTRQKVQTANWNEKACRFFAAQPNS